MAIGSVVARAWAQQQAAALRVKDWAVLDIEQLLNGEGEWEQMGRYAESRLLLVSPTG